MKYLQEQAGSGYGLPISDPNDVRGILRDVNVFHIWSTVEYSTDFHNDLLRAWWQLPRSVNAQPAKVVGIRANFPQCCLGPRHREMTWR